jgi:predicted membrane channel-forming protein YqfA (hemolysin III family)
MNELFHFAELATLRQEFQRLGSVAEERPQSREEEIAKSLTHGLGLAAALAAGAFLIVTTVQRGGAGFSAGISVNAATLVFLYTYRQIINGCGGA